MKNGILRQSEWVDKVREKHIKKAPEYENEFYEELCKRYGKVERYKFFGNANRYCCFIQMYIPDVRCAIEFDRSSKELDKEALKRKKERNRFIHSKHVKRFQANFKMLTEESAKSQFFDRVDKFVNDRRAGISVVSDRTMDMIVARSEDTPERREHRQLMGSVRHRFLDELKCCENCSFCRDNGEVRYCLRFTRVLVEDMGHVCPYHSYRVAQKQKELENVIRKKDAEIEEYKRKLAELTGKPGMKPVREARYREKRNPE